MTPDSLLEVDIADDEDEESESEEEPSWWLRDCLVEADVRGDSAERRRLTSDLDVSSSLASEPSGRDELLDLLPVIRRRLAYAHKQTWRQI